MAPGEGRRNYHHQKRHISPCEGHQIPTTHSNTSPFPHTAHKTLRPREAVEDKYKCQENRQKFKSTFYRLNCIFTSFFFVTIRSGQTAIRFEDFSYTSIRFSFCLYNMCFLFLIKTTFSITLLSLSSYHVLSINSKFPFLTSNNCFTSFFFPRPAKSIMLLFNTPFIFLNKHLTVKLKGRTVSPLLWVSTFCTKATENLAE